MKKAVPIRDETALIYISSCCMRQSKASENEKFRFHFFTFTYNKAYFSFYFTFQNNRFSDKEFVQRQECGLAAVQCDENDGGYRQVDVHLVNLSVYNHIIHLLFYFVNRLSRISAHCNRIFFIFRQNLTIFTSQD